MHATVLLIELGDVMSLLFLRKILLPHGADTFGLGCTFFCALIELSSLWNHASTGGTTLRVLPFLSSCALESTLTVFLMGFYSLNLLRVLFLNLRNTTFFICIVIVLIVFILLFINNRSFIYYVYILISILIVLF